MISQEEEQEEEISGISMKLTKITITKVDGHARRLILHVDVVSLISVCLSVCLSVYLFISQLISTKF